MKTTQSQLLIKYIQNLKKNIKKPIPTIFNGKRLSPPQRTWEQKIQDAQLEVLNVVLKEAIRLQED